ncbi:MAG: DUF945 family protein [Rhodothalassiaceae bacterium]
MRAPALIAAAAAGSILVWLGMTAIIGSKTEDALQQRLNALSGPSLQLSLADYRSGFFTSRGRITVVDRPQGERPPVRLTLPFHVAHGPLLFHGGFGFGTTRFASDLAEWRLDGLELEADRTSLDLTGQLFAWPHSGYQAIALEADGRANLSIGSAQDAVDGTVPFRVDGRIDGDRSDVEIALGQTRFSDGNTSLIWDRIEARWDGANTLLLTGEDARSAVRAWAMAAAEGQPVHLGLGIHGLYAQQQGSPDAQVRVGTEESGLALSLDNDADGLTASVDVPRLRADDPEGRFTLDLVALQADLTLDRAYLLALLGEEEGATAQDRLEQSGSWSSVQLRAAEPGNEVEVSIGPFAFSSVASGAGGLTVVQESDLDLQDMIVRSAQQEARLGRISSRSAIDFAQTDEDQLAIDSHLKLENMVLRGGDQPFRVDRLEIPMRIDGLQAEAFNRFVEGYIQKSLKLYDAMLQGRSPEEALPGGLEAIDELYAPLITALNPGAQARIDQAEAITSIGEAQLQAEAGVPVGDYALSRRDVLIRAVEAGWQLRLSEDMARGLAELQLSTSGSLPPNLPDADLQNAITQTIRGLAGQGMLVPEEDGGFMVRVGMEDGVLLLNGRPMVDVASSMGAPQQAGQE